MADWRASPPRALLPFAIAIAASILWTRRRSRRAASATPLVGVLGGLGPAASALLTRLVVAEAERRGARSDDEHACFVLYQNPSLPNSRNAALGDGQSPQPGMAATFRALVRAGCTEVCVCCNTAHPFARAAAEEVGVAFLDMIEATAHAALLQLCEDDRGAQLIIGLLATDATIRMGLYQTAVAKAAAQLTGCSDRVRVLVPPDDSIAGLQQCILDIKAGQHVGVGARIKQIANELVVLGAQCIITGCTELPVCFSAESYPAFPAPIVNPVQTLAAAIVQRSHNGNLGMHARSRLG
ncbi:hypothetical protein AB1Y20_000165 [Prymnesium parvum]|uniref:Aspartate racemase n=1 Tax=Prymnesium parvum TaxID=97485 RepID=A0AB34K9P6_PRYPA